MWTSGKPITNEDFEQVVQFQDIQWKSGVEAANRIQDIEERIRAGAAVANVSFEAGTGVNRKGFDEFLRAHMGETKSGPASIREAVETQALFEDSEMVQNIIWQMGKSLDGRQNIGGNELLTKCLAIGFLFGRAFEKREHAANAGQ